MKILYGLNHRTQKRWCWVVTNWLSRLSYIKRSKIEGDMSRWEDPNLDLKFFSKFFGGHEEIHKFHPIFKVYFLIYDELRALNNYF